LGFVKIPNASQFFRCGRERRIEEVDPDLGGVPALRNLVHFFRLDICVGKTALNQKKNDADEQVQTEWFYIPDAAALVKLGADFPGFGKQHAHGAPKPGIIIEYRLKEGLDPKPKRGTDVAPGLATTVAKSSIFSSVFCIAVGTVCSGVSLVLHAGEDRKSGENRR